MKQQSHFKISVSTLIIIAPAENKTIFFIIKPKEKDASFDVFCY